MGDALLCSYFALYFIRRGMDLHQQSVLLAMTPFALFVGCLFFSKLAKKPKRTLWLFRICAAIEAALALVFAFCDNYVALLILMPLIGFFDGAPFSLIEGYLVPMAKVKGARYSNIRLFGTIGYIVSLAAGFFLLEKLPLENSYYFSSVFFAISMALAFFLKDEDIVSEEPKLDGDLPKKNRINHKVLLFSAFYFFLYGTFNALMYLLPTRLNGLGFSNANYSMARSVAVMLELAMLLLMPFFSKFFRNPKVPLVVCGVMILGGSVFAIFLDQPFALAYLCMGLTGAGKAFLFAYQSAFLGQVVGDKNISSVLTIAFGSNNLATAILNLASSRIYEAIGFGGFFAILCGLEAIGLIALLLIALPTRGKKESEETSSAK